MGFNWRKAWISLDREVAINLATNIGLIDERHKEMHSRRSPSVEAWAEVEKLLGMSILAFMLFMEFFAQGLVLPVLMYWSEALGADSFEIGIAIGIHFGAQAVLAKQQTRFMTLWGFRPAALAATVGMALGYYIQYYAQSLASWSGMPTLRHEHWPTRQAGGKGAFEIFILGRIVSGGAGSIMPVARVFVTKLCPGRESTRMLTLVGILPPIAIILGHAVASGTSTYSIASPILLAAACCCASFAVGLLYLKEVRDIQGILEDVPEEDWQEKLRAEFSNISNTLVGELGDKLDVKIDLKQLHTLLPPSLRVLMEPNVGTSKKGHSSSKGGSTRGEVGSLSSFRALADQEARADACERELKRYHMRGTDDARELMALTLGVYTVLATLVCVSGFIVHASWWGFLTALPQYLLERFQFKALDYCFVLVCFSGLVPFTQAVLYPFLAPRAGKHMTAAMGVFIMVLALFSFTFANWPTVGDVSFTRGLMITIAPMPVGFGLYLSGSAALLKRYTRPPVGASKYHKVLTSYSVMSHMGAFVGCMSFGSLFDVNSFYPFYVNGGWTVLGFVLMMQIYAENQCLAEHKERDDEDFEARRFWKTVTIAAHTICIPWCVVRSGLGIKMCLDSWSKDCKAVLWKVYVCISISTVLLCIIPEAVMGLGFANAIVAIVAFKIHTGTESCAGTQWMQYVVIDMCIWASVLCLAFIFLTSSSVLRPTIDAIYSRFVRLVALPICLARVVLCIYIMSTHKEWNYNPPLSGESGPGTCPNLLLLKFSMFISLFSFFTTPSPKAFLGITFLSVAVGTMALVAAKDCKGGWAYWFTTLDTCINIFAMAAVYCIWFAVLNPDQEVKNSVKVFAGYAVGIPLSLARLTLGYLLCGSAWDTHCDNIALFKFYVIFSMFGFIFVRKVELFGTFTFVNTVIGLLCLTSTEAGCEYGMWRTFVLTDLWLGVGLSGLVYILWTHFAGHEREVDMSENRFTRDIYQAHNPSRIESARKASRSSDSGRVARPSVVEDFDEDDFGGGGSPHPGMMSQGSMRRDIARTETLSAVKVADARRKIKMRAGERKAGTPMAKEDKAIAMAAIARSEGKGKGFGATPAPMPRAAAAAAAASSKKNKKKEKGLTVEVDDPAGQPPPKESSPTTVAESPAGGASMTWTTTVNVNGSRYPFTLHQSTLVSELLAQVQDKHRLQRGMADQIAALCTSSGHELDLDEDVTRCIGSGQTMVAELED